MDFADLGSKIAVGVIATLVVQGFGFLLFRRRVLLALKVLFAGNDKLDSADGALSGKPAQANCDVAEDVAEIFKRSIRALHGNHDEACSHYREWEADSDAKTRAGDPVRIRPAAYRSFLARRGISV